MTTASDKAFSASYDVLLMEYAAGSLDRAHNMVISAHISMSPQARIFVERYEDVGGQLLEDLCEPVAMNTTVETFLDKLDTQAPETWKTRRKCVLPDDLLLPECFETSLHDNGPETLAWSRIYPGIQSIKIPFPDCESSLRIYKMNAGARAPSHTHNGMEATLILEGAFSDEFGTYTVGDLVVRDIDNPAHSPQACPDQGCLCISVLSKSLELTGPIGRFLNNFIRF